ncbi:MAG TPA: hypothetical protein VFF73_39150, partial [Planctomycetota bacterium]|nr:hypothetical protein [Planctomycetota bacterium]
MPSVSQRNKALAPFKDLRRATEIIQILVQHGFGYLLNSKALAQVPELKPGDVNEKVKALPRPE